MPAAEVDVDEPLVRRLLLSQFAGVDEAAAALPLRLIAAGWDNVTFRLGDALAVRVPRREMSAGLIANEARCLPLLAPVLPVAVPVPVFVGAADEDFPWPWSVVPWIDGDVVASMAVADRSALVEPLSAALIALHRRAPADAPSNRFRGVPLADRAEVVAGRWSTVADFAGGTAAAALRTAWESGLDAPVWEFEPRWLHGDLHPLNLLHRGNDLAGIIDFGDVTSGDPSNDLAVALMTFGADDRARFRQLVDASGDYDGAVWLRAAAWAASFTTAVICDEASREPFGSVIAHTIAQLHTC